MGVRERVYIETTIPSFYYNRREEPEHVARCQWTRRFWADYRHNFDLFTSPIVIAELRAGDHPNREEKLNLLKDVAILDYLQDVEQVGKIYVKNFLMPARTFADAIHMAFASVYQCDILLTWNCAHLANLNKRSHLETINARLGLRTPLVVTPLELLGNYDDE